MQFFLGLDGGGTRTRAFLTDAAGRRCAWMESGLSDPNHSRPEELAANLDAAIGGVCAKAGIGREQCGSVFAGMAGVTDEAGRAAMAERLAACGLAGARIGVEHDIRIALAGGLIGRPGIALIVGTGSSCYGRTAEGRTWQSGGWGSLVADEGSGYFLGREALVAAVRMADGRQAESALLAAVFAWLGIDAVAEMMHRIYTQGLSRTEIAGFAPRVVALADGGDAAAIEILDRGADLLARMVEANHRRLPTGPAPEVVVTGGLGTAETIYRQKIHSALRASLPDILIRPPALAPVIGAALLALEQAGEPRTETLTANLKQFSP